MSKNISSLSFLVVGCGSIGIRHAKNLKALGALQIAVCDSNLEAARRCSDEVGGDSYIELSEALEKIRPDAVLICTPPHLHADQGGEVLARGYHVFMEKPLAHDLPSLEKIKGLAEKSKNLFQVGYNLRFNPGLQRLKEQINQGVLGEVLWARLEVGQYLPDWRPKQDYRKGYTVRSDMGGGIILDASHEIDYALWLFGEPVDIRCMAGTLGTLEMDVENCATILLRFADGVQADIHLDCLQRTYTRTCKVVGSMGTIEWDYAASTIRIWTEKTKEWQEEFFAFETNDMYLAELKHFADCILNEEAPSVNINDGAKALKVAMAAKDDAALEEKRGLQ